MGIRPDQLGAFLSRNRNAPPEDLPCDAATGRYTAHIWRGDVRITQSPCVDYFESDSDAAEQYREILREQGYTVIDVKPGPHQWKIEVE